MTLATILELLAGAALLLGGIGLYVRKPAGGDGKPDTQGPVLLMAVGAIVLIHGLGMLEYRPTAGDIDAMRAAKTRQP